MKNSSNHVFWLQILNFENCVLTILRITSCFCCSTQLFQNGTNEGPMRVLYDNQWLYVFSHRRSWWDSWLITFLVVIYIFFQVFWGSQTLVLYHLEMVYVRDQKPLLFQAWKSSWCSMELVKINIVVVCFFFPLIFVVYLFRSIEICLVEWYVYIDLISLRIENQDENLVEDELNQVGLKQSVPQVTHFFSLIFN